MGRRDKSYHKDIKEQMYDKLTGMLEDDEDVTNVYTTLKPEE